MALPNIKSLSSAELSDFLAAHKQPKFRARQIEEWLFVHRVHSFDAMTNLPKALRALLAESFSLEFPHIVAQQQSSDGTRKYLVEFSDGVSVETVGIPSTDDSRLTVCFSTQAGCAMGCCFCATGLAGFTRNIDAGEMFDQVALVSEDFGRRVTNVVAMGQGEPFANYQQSLLALKRMNSECGLGIGARHITVSTCGIIKGIEKFALEPEQFTLAVSLHSALQQTRNEIMPGVSNVSLESLKESLKYYGDSTKRRPSLEYALICDVNDTDEHLSALIDFCRGMLCHVNLIPLNPVDPADASPTTMQPSTRLDYFESSLRKAGVEVSIRNSRGADIDGACGQLKQRINK